MSLKLNSFSPDSFFWYADDDEYHEWRCIPCTGESGHPVHQRAKIPCTGEAVTNLDPTSSQAHCPLEVARGLLSCFTIPSRVSTIYCLLTMKVHRFRALDSFGIRALASFRSASLLVGLGVAPPVTRKRSAFGSGWFGLWNFGLAAGQVEVVYWKWTNHLWPAGAETSTGKHNTTASLSDNLLRDECVCGWTCTHLTQARKPS